MLGFRIIRQYEQGIVFRWGRALPGTRKPGLIWINPLTDRLRKVNMQITVAPVPAQETITRDNVTLRVDAVVYYRVVDPLKAIVNVQNYQYAVGQVAQTPLARGDRAELHGPAAVRPRQDQRRAEGSDRPPRTEGAWGVRVERVEVKDVSLAESMKRSMSRQAEAERERRARIIAADGEYQAAKKLAQAGAIMAGDPAALQLRLLQTFVEVAAEKNKTIVVPVPVEVLRFLDRKAPGQVQADPPAAGTQGTPALPSVPVPLPNGKVPALLPGPTQPHL